MIRIHFRSSILALLVLTFLVCAGPAFAAPMPFTVQLTGAQQVPPVTTSGSGTADLTWDPAKRVLGWHVTFQNLSSPATMAHFHRGARGHNGPPVIWLTKKGESVASPIDGRATLTKEQAKQFEDGDWYINVHTKDHKSGEIRGQVVPPSNG